MISILMCAAGVKRYEELAKAFAHLARAILPKPLHAAFTDLPLLKKSLPGHSTIFRYQLVVDAAYMIFLRDLQLEPASYFTLDSSPQGSRDWLLCRRSSIKVGCMGELMRAVHALTCDPTSDALDVPRRTELTATIRESIASHIMPPMALGQRHSDLAHKMSCFVQSVFLEEPSWPRLHERFDSTYSFCVDMGTESGVADFLALQVKQLLPTWMRPGPEIEDDVGGRSVGLGGALHCNGGQSSDMEVEHDGARRGNDGQSSDVDLEDDVYRAPAPYCEVDDSAHAEVDTDPRVGPPPPLPEVPTHLFVRALLIPGPLHILHNAMKFISVHLKHYLIYQTQLRTMSQFVTQRTLDLFCQTCLHGTAFHTAQHHFHRDTFPKLIEWCWGSNLGLIKGLLTVVRPLRACWSDQKMFASHVADADVERDREDEDRLDAAFVRSIGLVVRSNLFWSYSTMLTKLFGVLHDLMSWSESCACHEVHTPSEDRTEMEAAVAKLGEDCPMRGRRAVDMAQGRWRDALACLRESTLSDLRGDAALFVRREDSDIVVEDFLKGAAELEAVLEMKLNFWQALPWLLCGLGDHDLGASRACAIRCMQMYDDVPIEAAHHRVTNKFLAAKGLLRSQLQLYVNGRPLDELPELQHEIACLMFSLTVERIIEGTHSVLKRLVQFRMTGGSFISFRLRLKEMEALAEADDTFIAKLAEKCERHPRKFAELLRVDEHPQLQELSWRIQQQGDRVAREDYRKFLAHIIYRCDMSTQFFDHSATKKEHKRAKETRGKAAAGYVAKTAKRALTEDAVISHAMVLHFQDVASPDHWYSLPSQFLKMCAPLKVALQTPAAQAACTASGDELEDDTMHDRFTSSFKELECGDRIFFRILSTRSDRAKVIVPDVGAGGRLRKGDMTITVHAPLNSQETEDLPMLSLQPWQGASASSAFVLKGFPELEALPDLHTSFLTWTRRSSLQYFGFFEG